MGIKGRRKKLQAREAKERERQSAEGFEDAADGAVVVMGDGPYRPPVDAAGNLHLKRSEWYKLQDQEYLERIREDHRNRRSSHLASFKRARDEGEGDGDEEAELEQELLGRHYDTEEAIARLTNSADDANPTASSASQLLEKRRRGGNGALMSHPLIGLDSDLVRALVAEGFVRMTTIQERCIPYALEGYDLLGQARTGSGKTLAFCVPILHMASEALRTNPRAMVALMLAPTKELCVQTHDVLQSVCRHMHCPAGALSIQLITGGTKVTEERRRLSAGASIVVGTPGRVHDHVMHCKAWDLTRLRFLVLDEADRMLDDGFQRNLDAIIAQLPRGRQTFLFSATNTKSVRELARLSLTRTPIFIDTSGRAPLSVQIDGGESAVGHPLALGGLPPYRTFADPDTPAPDTAEDEEDAELQLGASGEGEPDEDERTDASVDNTEAGAIPSTLRQFCRLVPFEDRLLSLYIFVKRVARRCKAMVFCSTVASTTFHFQVMGSVGFHNDVMMLHGHMKHRQRVQTFRMFSESKATVLFCTDVAARGLDIPDVEWILQYDPPLDPTEYIHRIGRTARAGSVGNSLIFLAPEEAEFIRYLHKFGMQLEKYPMPSSLPRIQEKLEHVLQLDAVVAKSAVAAYRAHVGAYQGHILKETFNIRRLDLQRLATAFALTTAPHVTLPKNTAEEKKSEYVKGKLKSLNRRRMDALKHYELMKTKTQWDNGNFVGLTRPS